MANDEKKRGPDRPAAVLTRAQFDALADRALLDACFAPLIADYKAHQLRSASFVETFRRLTAGQRALFLFMAYYNHAEKSFAEFYWWSAYFYAKPAEWAGIRDSFAFYGIEALSALLADAEEALRGTDHARTLEGFAASREHLERDEALRASFEPLHARFEAAVPDAVARVAAHIRGHAGDYALFADE